MSDFYPTKHLMEKLQTRNVTWAEVVSVIEKPEVVYGPDYRGRKTLQRGDLCVIVGRDGGVVTVLLRDADQWDDNDVIERNNEGL